MTNYFASVRSDNLCRRNLAGLFADVEIRRPISVNPAFGETRANLVVATINPGSGKISVFNNTGSLDVIVDVLGWYS